MIIEMMCRNSESKAVVVSMKHVLIDQRMWILGGSSVRLMQFSEPAVV